MDGKQPSVAIFTGSFDPFTNGHMDIIERGRRLFDKLIVAVGRNPDKPDLFSLEERVAMIEELVKDMPDVSVEAYDGLTVDFARRRGAKVILRGIRDIVDLRSELQQANTNLLVGGVETVFILTSHDHALTSSTLIKQIVLLGGHEPKQLERLVPLSVAHRLSAKLRGSGIRK
jgi:pantetheine-phosphate adenylyltransferase